MGKAEGLPAKPGGDLGRPAGCRDWRQLGRAAMALGNPALHPSDIAGGAGISQVNAFASGTKPSRQSMQGRDLHAFRRSPAK